MKMFKNLIVPFMFIGLIALAIGWRETKKVEAYPGTSLRKMVDETCGACHSNIHVREAGGFSLESGASAHAGGVIANSRGIDPTVPDIVGDPTSALIIQKPMEGSVTPHGGIKLSSQTAVMQALIDWVENGAPAAELDRPVQPAPAYVSANVAAGEHEIVYSRRVHRREGFNDLRGWTAGGNIYRMIFDHDPTAVTTNTIISNVNITNLPGTDDAQNPTVSLDGTKVAFARKQPGMDWKIWEVGIDGNGLRQITTSGGNHIQPVYLPYLPDGTEARDGSGGVAFMSDAAGFRDEYDQATTLSLYVCDANGGNVRQIDFNPSHDLHPTLHSSGMLIMTRWEHNEHQRHNFMPLHQISISDYLTAGTNLFGAYGEHGTGALDGAGGNSLHESTELLDPVDPAHGTFMIARGSDRDNEGGSIVGPFFPRLQGEVNTNPVAGLILRGDNAGDEMMDADVSSVTFREPASLLNGLFVVSGATLVSANIEFNAFTMSSETVRIYSNFALETLTVTNDPTEPANHRLTAHQRRPLLEVPGMNVDEACPVVVRQQPPKIGKPIDLTQFTGTFTSGDVTDRQNDGQPNSFSVDDISVVRFIRSLQLSQGQVDTGKRRGISTQIVGEATISSDGSFSAAVPANVPMQFQLIDKNGRVLVNHKPWIHVAPGATERCVGCHAVHDKVPTPQTLEARQLPSQQIVARSVTQFHFHQDIQPILNAKCISCHDNAAVHGASGYNPNRPGSKPVSLVGRMTPANVTESYQSLTGASEDMMMNAYVRTQYSRQSPLIHWLTGLKLDAVPTPTAFPTPAALVDHSIMLTEAELDKIVRWIDTGTNFRVVEDNVPNPLQDLNLTTFRDRIWPIMEDRGCVVCHGDGGAGQGAMDLGIGNAESEEEAEENRIEALAEQMNFMIPEASPLLRKPLGEALGGLSHVGGQIWTGMDDPDYLAIFQWIVASNPQLNPAAQPAHSDLVKVNNYPNPFRDTTNFVYQLGGPAATRVDIEIYSMNGKLIREFPGTTNTATMGWNSVTWDGKDKNGKTVANDTYFFVIKAEFGDGVKKKVRGKCVKVN